MDLRDFFINGNLTQRAFAMLVPCSHHYVCMIAAKKMRPGRLLAQRIVEITEGKVTLQDLDYPKKTKKETI